MSRVLTGQWYIKRIEKRRFCGLMISRNFEIMVEVFISNPFYPEPYHTYEKARPSDIIDLGINIL